MNQNAQNIVWSERCRREAKGAAIFLQKAQSVPRGENQRHHLTTKWATGPGTINERGDRFLDRNVPLLTALSNFVSREDTPEARYVKSYAPLRREKVASPPIGGSTRRSVSRLDTTATSHDETTRPNRGLNAAIGAGNLFGTSLITEGMVPSYQQPMSVQECRREKERRMAVKAAEMANEGEIKLPEVVRKEIEKRSVGRSTTSMSQTQLSVPRADQERRQEQRASSTTSGDYGWIPPSRRVAVGSITPTHHARFEWRDPRLNHPLSQTDITRVIFK